MLYMLYHILANVGKHHKVGDSKLHSAVPTFASLVNGSLFTDVNLVVVYKYTTLRTRVA